MLFEMRWQTDEYRLAYLHLGLLKNKFRFPSRQTPSNAGMLMVYVGIPAGSRPQLVKG
jgi:hypothetical protein